MARLVCIAVSRHFIFLMSFRKRELLQDEVKKFARSVVNKDSSDLLPEQTVELEQSLMYYHRPSLKNYPYSSPSKLHQIQSRNSNKKKTRDPMSRTCNGIWLLAATILGIVLIFVGILVHRKARTGKAKPPGTGNLRQLHSDREFSLRHSHFSLDSLASSPYTPENDLTDYHI